MAHGPIARAGRVKTVGYPLLGNHVRLGGQLDPPNKAPQVNVFGRGHRDKGGMNFVNPCLVEEAIMHQAAPPKLPRDERDQLGHKLRERLVVEQMIMQKATSFTITKGPSSRGMEELVGLIIIEKV